MLDIDILVKIMKGFTDLSEVDIYKLPLTKVVEIIEYIKCRINGIKEMDLEDWELDPEGEVFDKDG